MSRFVVDSNVVSEIVRPRPEPRVAAFLNERSDLWLSAIVFHELAYGVARLALGARVEVLNNYIEQMKRRFHGRIVAIDVHLAEVAGRLRGAEFETRAHRADPRLVHRCDGDRQGRDADHAEYQALPGVGLSSGEPMEGLAILADRVERRVAAGPDAGEGR